MIADDRADLIEWLRELRERSGSLDLEVVKRRVLEATRARTGYHAIRVVFENDTFEYHAVTEG